LINCPSLIIRRRRLHAARFMTTSNSRVDDVSVLCQLSCGNYQPSALERRMIMYSVVAVRLSLCNHFLKAG